MFPKICGVNKVNTTMFYHIKLVEKNEHKTNINPACYQNSFSLKKFTVKVLCDFFNSSLDRKEALDVSFKKKKKRFLTNFSIIIKINDS